ncbi:protein trichome birefringence-like 14 isoform X2 [Punica granatum]|uniref:Protein trichome birefringence-like 14 isoform X2 n=2 Tax=Punica granatum TaxID=22663 RepID=A0A218WUN4_PUNGR|nr:protein trichome birefringence-like 14 isoform X2 [Punica granatum]XP_031402260.1 protein trichome birefringence-like 14 isoform X2 [Punica granatum]OWM76363.1 hypothetical protein CDL15_Pgr028233 [Punica granatum]
MKGGSSYRVRARHFSLTLIAVVFTTLFLWIWEKNPFLHLAQDQFLLPSSEFISDLPDESLLNVKEKEHFNEVDPNYVRPETYTKAIQESDIPFNNSTSTSSSSIRKVDGHSRTSSTRKVCNYAKGSWVPDNRRPLYSGRKCKQWLSEMWACRLTQRTDFSYEGFRWQPDDCEMPDFDRFAFMKRMEGKTIAFVGDSLGRQQFQSLMCMVTGGEETPEVEDVGREYGLIIAKGNIRPDGWAFRFPPTNTTILYYWSSSLCDLQPLNASDPKTEVAMHLDRPPAFLSRFLDRFNVLILNTGHHWNRGKINANRWVMYINGQPNQDRRLAAVGNAKNFTVHSIARWIDSQLPSHPRLKAFFRTISPRHFANGEWNTGGSCDNMTPLSKGSTVSKDESSDIVVESAVQGTRVKILDITALSELRDEGHIARFSVKATEGIQDCLHWCLPGIPDTWNEVLCAQI